MTDAFSNPVEPAESGDDSGDFDDPSAEAEVLAELVRAAAAGDRDAAGEYFAKMLPALTLTAKRVAGISHDADDLLGDALLVVLAKWSEGTGPTDNVPAYIAQTMRNRIRDDFRSPRSRVAPLDNVEEPASNADPRIRELEIESELAVVRRALGELPEDQQRVLIATVLEGMKPRELEQHLARPASAIYSLSRRARGNLRRTTLRLLLEENARPECVAAAQLLPEAVGDSPEDTKANRSTEHYRTCKYCRRSWKRFAGLATLGVLPVAAATAVALAGPAGSAEASTGPAGAPVEASGAGAGSVPGDAGGDASFDVTDTVSGASNLHDWGRMAAMLAAAGTALVLITVVTVTFITKTWFFSAPPKGALDVAAVSIDAGHSEFDMDFVVDDDSWKVHSLLIDLSADVESVAAPAGWECAVSEGDVMCTTSLDSPRGGVFEIAHATGTSGLGYAFFVTGSSGSGATITSSYSHDLER